MRRCVQDVVNMARRTSGAASTRYLLAVACVAAVDLAYKEKLLSMKPTFTQLYRATILSCCITLAEVEDIVNTDEKGK